MVWQENSRGDYVPRPQSSKVAIVHLANSTPPKQNLGGSWRAPGVARVHASPRSTGGLEEGKKKKECEETGRPFHCKGTASSWRMNERLTLLYRHA